MLRKKIVEALKRRGVDTLFNEHVMGVYGKEDAPNCENYLITTADQIIPLIKEAKYVKLAEDQSLPECKHLAKETFYLNRVCPILKTNWRKVEL